VEGILSTFLIAVQEKFQLLTDMS